MKRKLALIIYNLIDFISNFRTTKEKKMILLVKIDEIGDFIIWQDSAKEFKKIYKDKKIVLLCNEIYLDLAKALPYFDFVIPLNKKKFSKNLLYRYNFLVNIKKNLYEKVIAPTYTRDYFIHDWIIKNTRAYEKIGFEADLENIDMKLKEKSDLWYTKLIKTSSETKMEILRNAEFIRGLGLTEFKGTISNLRLFIKENTKFDIKGEYITVFLGASIRKRCWDPRNFAKVINSLEKKYTIVLLGVDSEKELVESFILELKNFRNIINLVGETTLLETMEIIKSARVVLGNESGAIHMGTSLGIPSLVILGGGHFGRFMPYTLEYETDLIKPIGVFAEKKPCFNCNWRCIYPVDKTWRCIKEVPVKEVISRLNNILKRGD